MSVCVALRRTGTAVAVKPLQAGHQYLSDGRQCIVQHCCEDEVHHKLEATERAAGAPLQQSLQTPF